MTDERIPQALIDYLKTSVRVALAEDVGTGDLTAALVPAAQRVRAHVVTREACEQTAFHADPYALWEELLRAVYEANRIVPHSTPHPEWN